MKTVEQMALLNCLMYYEIDFKLNMTLEDLILELQENPKKWNKIMKSHPGVMSKEKTKAVIDAIIQDDELRKMRIIANTEESAKIKGQVSICLVDEKNKEAVFCFRGTNSAEWLDNGDGFMKESSKLQKEALSFFETTIEKKKLLEKGYQIDVTGHSKGGNKAQYIAVKHPAVRNCYSFEGQGFSKEFVKANGREIAERRHKIVTYAADKDYVNPLGIDIAGEHKFYKTLDVLKYNWNLPISIPVINGLLSHSPGAYFEIEDRQVRMNSEVEQSKLSKEIHTMTLEMMDADDIKRHSYFIGTMGMLQRMQSCEPIVDGLSEPNAEELLHCMKDVVEFFVSRNASDELINMVETVQSELTAQELEEALQRLNINQSRSKVVQSGEEMPMLTIVRGIDGELKVKEGVVKDVMEPVQKETIREFIR